MNEWLRVVLIAVGAYLLGTALLFSAVHPIYRQRRQTALNKIWFHLAREIASFAHFVSFGALTSPFWRHMSPLVGLVTLGLCVLLALHITGRKSRAIGRWHADALSRMKDEEEKQ